jgi:hypothetical protein
MQMLMHFAGIVCCLRLILSGWLSKTAPSAAGDHSLVAARCNSQQNAHFVWYVHQGELKVLTECCIDLAAPGAELPAPLTALPQFFQVRLSALPCCLSVCLSICLSVCPARPPARPPVRLQLHQLQLRQNLSQAKPSTARDLGRFMGAAPHGRTECAGRATTTREEAVAGSSILRGAASEASVCLANCPSMRLQAAAEADAQGVMQAASAACSPWFMAHSPHLMLGQPAGDDLLRTLPHFGGDQVCLSVRPSARPPSIRPLIRLSACPSMRPSVCSSVHCCYAQAGFVTYGRPRRCVFLASTMGWLIPNRIHLVLLGI